MASQQQELEELVLPADIERMFDAPMRCGDETVGMFFLRLVSQGTSPRLAEALAMQQCPGIGVTDTMFLADQNRHGRSILDRMSGDPLQVEILRKTLAKRGYRLKDDDHYIPTAARFYGDPAAIVNNTQTLSDLKKRIRNQGTGASGVVDQEGQALGPRRQRHRLHPRIVNRIDQKRLAQNPDLAKIPVQDRHADIVAKHGSKKKD